MAERRRARRPAGEETELWRRTMHDVVPLRGRPSPPPADPAPPARPDEARAVAPAVMPDAPARVLPSLARFADIDRASAERLKRGRMAIEAQLDLHGLTQDEAHRALTRFVAGSRAVGRRCVLVITGRGLAGGGVLRTAVPRWLDEPGLRPHILAITPAQPRDGGAGALYLLLRRSTREPALADRAASP